MRAGSGKQRSCAACLLSNAASGQTAIFPSPWTPPQVRALAAAADLPNKARKDSQGICFLGKVKFSEFIK